MNKNLDQTFNSKSKSALLAVSGGVDSIVLLDLLAKFNPNSKKTFDSTKSTKSTIEEQITDFLKDHPINRLEVAYIDHAQRDDTKKDIEQISKLTNKYKLKLHLSKLNTKKDSSEELLRSLRYQELRRIQQKNNLDHLITAHHVDDVLETAIINIQRGTSPKGLSSLKHHPDGIWRPFLYKNLVISKREILNYAKENNLTWHEDSTNQNTKYLRNSLRKKLDDFDPHKKTDLIKILNKNQTEVEKISNEVDILINNLKLSENIYSKIKYLDINQEKVRHEILHKILSEYGYEISKETVIKADDFLKNKTTHKIMQIRGCHLKINSKETFSVFSTAKKDAIIST